MPKFTAKQYTRVWQISAIIAVIIFVIGFVLIYVPLIGHIFTYSPTPPAHILDDPDPTVLENYQRNVSLNIYNESFTLFHAQIESIDLTIDVTDVTMLALMVLIFPIAMMYLLEERWRRGIDAYLPSLLREVADAQKTGLPLPRAITEAAKRQYGPFTEPLRKMSAKISWGVAFEKGMDDLAAETGTELVKRSTVLILESERSGGSMDDVFDATHQHVNELLALERARRSSMSAYTYIIYAAYLVFAFVVVLLLQTFFLSMSTLGQFDPGAAAGLSIPIRTELPFNLAGLQLIFFHMLIIEGVLAGVVAGKMGDGSAKLGLRHSFILCTAGYLLFKIVVCIFHFSIITMGLV
ncbi:MAG: type II secretion system F family protein [Candidatus Hodarchaeota archaeon]